MLIRKLLPFILFLSLLLVACGSAPTASSGFPQAVASTTIVGDVVSGP